MTGLVITTGGQHPDDGALLALIDGERISDVSTHVQDCRACDERVARLRQASELFRASLEPVAVPPLSAPRRRARVLTYPIVAAAGIVLLASAAMATPIRTWIIRQLLPEAPLANAPRDPGPRPAVAPASGIIASFAATDTLLTIQVEAHQRAGAVHLTAATGERISAQAVSGAAAEELIVLPGRLRIRNSETSVADYRIAIPAGVRTVAIVVGGNRVAVVTYDPGLDRRVPLR